MSLAKRLSFLTFSLFSICIIALCMGLGFWQLQRLEWKTKLLQSVADTTASSYQAFAPDQIWPEFSKVSITGRYVHDLAIRLHPRMLHGKVGSQLLSPLLTTSGQLVYVLRGWVPRGYITVSSNSLSQVFGVIITPRRPRWFVPKNDVQAGEWHTINFQDIHSLVSDKKSEFASNVAPFYVLEQPQLYLRSPHVPL